MMSEREQQTAALLARGLGNKAIARELGVSVGTIKCHVRAVLRATGAANRTAAAVQIVSRRLIAAPE